MTNTIKEYDAIVIGAGVIGITTAEALSAKGLSVLVVDKNPQAASETSQANGGMITPGMSEPWASAGLPIKMLGWIGKEDAPALLRLRALPGMFSWGIAFLKNCSDRKWAINARRMIALGNYSAECLVRLVHKYQLQDCVDHFGTLRVFRDNKAAKAAKPAIDFMRANGIRCNEISAQQCVQIEPALAHLQNDIVTAYYYPEDLSGDCCQFTRALAKLLKEQGVDFAYSSPVESLTKVATQRWKITTKIHSVLAKRVVLATAAGSKHLLGNSVKQVLSYPVKGYSKTYDIPQAATDTAIKTPVMDDAIKIGIVRLRDQLRVVGTAEFCGQNTDITPARLKGLSSSASSLLPTLHDYEVSHDWACCRPMSPDGVPYVGELEAGLFVNISHGSLGWTNACGAAALLGDMLTDNKPKIDPHDYAPRTY